MKDKKQLFASTVKLQNCQLYDLQHSPDDILSRKTARITKTLLGCQQEHDHSLVTVWRRVMNW